jgi:glycosyltransferase involved in cell wall biosynthesis
MTARQQSEAERPEPLRIAYLFSEFPVPTQAFALSDILALRDLGHEVSIHAVKPAPRDLERRMVVCAVPADLPIRWACPRGMLRWPALIWRRRRIAASLAATAVRALPQGLAASLSALAVLPRTLEIAEEVTNARADVAHAFWARHAGMALYALERTAPHVTRSTFAGAYDLVADDFILDMSLAAAEVAFTHAEANRTTLLDRGVREESIRVVHRGIPLTLGDGRAGTRDRDRWITAAALVPEKNVQAVIRAFARARTERPQLTLRICGEGSWRPRLEALAIELGCASSVSFLGHLERGAVFREMTRAACFLLLSTKPSERLPNVVKEALLAGCAVITSNSIGIRELIPDEGIGHVVQADDDDAVAAAADAISAEDEAAAEARRARARAHIAACFSTDASMRHYVRVWRSLRPTSRAQSAPPGRRMQDGRTPGTVMHAEKGA